MSFVGCNFFSITTQLGVASSILGCARVGCKLSYCDASAVAKGSIASYPMRCNVYNLALQTIVLPLTCLGCYRASTFIATNVVLGAICHYLYCHQVCLVATGIQFYYHQNHLEAIVGALYCHQTWLVVSCDLYCFVNILVGKSSCLYYHHNIGLLHVERCCLQTFVGIATCLLPRSIICITINNLNQYNTWSKIMKHLYIIHETRLNN
jgi:hypothetical protein